MKNFLDEFDKRLNLNRLAFDTVIKEYRSGMSEADIKDIIIKAFHKNEKTPFEFSGDVVSGKRSSEIEGEATEYILKEGDSLILDIQPGFNGCYADTTRTFFVGKISDKQRKAYEAVLSALGAMEKALSQKKRACDVYRAMQEELSKFNLSCPHHAGHTVGKEKLLEPRLIEDCKEPIVEGMIIALEPGVYFENEFGIRIENNYLITKDGIKELFNYPLEIEKFII